MPKNISGVPAGRSVFHLTSPLIGLLNTILGWLDSSSNPHVLRCFLRPSLTEAPSLDRSYPASLVLRASPSPQTAQPDSHELPVDRDLRSPLGFPVLQLVPFFACMPSPLPRQVRWILFARTVSINVGLPQLHGGSAPALHVSRPAQRSLTLRPTCLPSRPKRPSTPEAPTASFPPPPLRLLPGGANQFPGGTLARSGPVPFHGARVNACYQHLSGWVRRWVVFLTGNTRP